MSANEGDLPAAEPRRKHRTIRTTADRAARAGPWPALPSGRPRWATRAPRPTGPVGEVCQRGPQIST